jgi:hypothetical protein
MDSSPSQPTAQPIARVWNPPLRAVGWTGRETEVQSVKDLLEANPRVALVGPGGIGKTAVAAQVIFELAESSDKPGMFPGGVFSHDYYRQAGHDAALVGLLGQAGVVLRGITDVTGEVRRLFSRPGVLLYLEGCEKAEDIMALLDLTAQAKVLLTSRYKDKIGDALAFGIHPLPEADGAQLLHYHAGRKILPAEPVKREPWLKLARELGGHPLALRLAGAWMAGQQESPAEFSASLKTVKLGDWALREQRR